MVHGPAIFFAGLGITIQQVVSMYRVFSVTQTPDRNPHFISVHEDTEDP